MLPRATAVLALLALLAGCNRVPQAKTGTSPSSRPAAGYLALGDSYTIGESVAPADRYPNQLAALVRAEHIPLDDPLTIAGTGWTTDELAASIDAANPPSGPYRLVTLLIGVNNQYRGRPQNEFRTQLDALVTRAITFAGGNPRNVIVISIPDWSVTPFAAGQDRARIAREIDALNAICRDVATAAGATFVNVTDLSRRAADDPSLVAPDGLHPSARMYQQWADRLLPVARDILTRRP